MKLHFLDDLHLEFGPYPVDDLPEADILALGGDIMVAFYLKKEGAEYNEYRNTVYHFFKAALEKYKFVLYTPGNHEHYNHFFPTTVAKIRGWFEEKFPSDHQRIIFGDREKWDYNGVTFLLATLWTDFEKNNPNSMLAAQTCMGDYDCIYQPRDDVGYRVNLPQDTYNEHIKSREWLAKEISDAEKVDGKVVVISHMAPSWQSIDPYFKDSTTNGAYCSDLEWLMGGAVVLWMHGHVHSKHDYDVKGTRVLTNPRGYFGYNRTGYDKDLIIEL